MAKDTMFMEELTDQELEQVNGGCYSSCGYYGGSYGGSYCGSSSSYYGGSYSGGGYYYAAVGYGYSC
ncbi:bacteriocin [Rothia aeria]|uniref:bacteriocin n=1 Tax=Rothia aeria TaxID=172042 RepID=UPI00241D21E8|nr:bacteriocin [Rothia aeria]